ncbi:MAG: hypothetical protein ACK5CY_01795 [Bacteroidia bacterium]|jgi:hypothetical protein
MLQQVERVDLLNIGLMLVSFALAFLLPFELFLFAYAVMGPLHYLTEMGWLKEKGFFTKGKYDYIVLTCLVICITLGFFNYNAWFKDATTNFIYLGFAAACFMAFIGDNTIKVIALIFSVFSILVVSRWDAYETLFAIYLPTIIHVFLFTGIFMLFGALKNRSRIGVIAVALLPLLGSLFFLFPSAGNLLASDDYIISSYGGFAELNRNIINLTGLLELKPFSELTAKENFNAIFHSEAGFSVMRFVAFAYTYHYLNWFSKTSVIKWHRVPKVQLMGVIGIWLGSIALYLYDYSVGLKWLFLLSFLHVLLEFPLNFVSFTGIFKETFALFTQRKRANQA